MNKAQVSPRIFGVFMLTCQANTDLAHLTDLTQSQAKRLDDMTILVATLQKENAELRMAAMSAQQQQQPPLPGSTSKPDVQPDEVMANTIAGQEEETDQGQLSPSRNKRPARSRNSS